MTVKRHFWVGGKWVTVEPSHEQGLENVLCMNVRNMDRTTGEPGDLVSSIPMSRNQIFDLACGLFCVVLDSEPEGVFDTSHSLEANLRSLGLSENVSDLMALTEMDDPSRAVTKTVAMYRRLDSRLPVLQACQRALELCENEFEVNILNEMASRMERGIPVGLKIPETEGKQKHLEVSSATPADLGFAPVPKSVLNGRTRSVSSDWFRVKKPESSPLASVVNKINGFLAKIDEHHYQIRSDLVAPDRELDQCIFSPALDLKALNHFCSISMPTFEALARQNQKAIDAGEAPIPSKGIKSLLIGEVQGAVH
jgi:hypothetical protein